MKFHKQNLFTILVVFSEAPSLVTGTCPLEPPVLVVTAPAVLQAVTLRSPDTGSELLLGF